jgi:hypothetical protein
VFGIGLALGVALAQGPTEGGKTTYEQSVRLVTVTVAKR